MKPILHLATSTLLFFATVSAIPQQAVPPPPRPADSGPSLEATMQYIQQKLSAIGTVTWIQPRQNTHSGFSVTDEFNVELSQITADASKCRIRYHFKWTRDAQVIYDEDSSFYLKEVRDVVVEPLEQSTNRALAKLGHLDFVVPTGSLNPPVTVLRVRFAEENESASPFLFPEEFERAFLFLDASDADRTAKAITHAIELCGGGGKELF